MPTDKTTVVQRLIRIRDQSPPKKNSRKGASRLALCLQLAAETDAGRVITEWQRLKIHDTKGGFTKTISATRTMSDEKRSCAALQLRVCVWSP